MSDWSSDVCSSDLENFTGNKQAMYQVMQRNSQGLLHMVDQLLDISKIESDKMILQAVQTDLRAFLKPVAAAYDSLAQSKEISFDFEMEENISLYQIGRASCRERVCQYV